MRRNLELKREKIFMKSREMAKMLKLVFLQCFQSQPKPKKAALVTTTSLISSLSPLGQLPVGPLLPIPDCRHITVPDANATDTVAITAASVAPR